MCVPELVPRLSIDRDARRLAPSRVGRRAANILFARRHLRRVSEAVAGARGADRTIRIDRWRFAHEPVAGHATPGEPVGGSAGDVPAGPRLVRAQVGSAWPLVAACGQADARRRRGRSPASACRCLKQSGSRPRVGEGVPRSPTVYGSSGPLRRR
jgi:hypothetical protein